MAKRRLAVEIVGDADKLDKAYKDGADGGDRFEKRTSASFDKAGKSADGFESKVSGMSAKSDGWAKDLVLGLGAGAGALAAGLFVKGFADVMDREAGQARLGIQLGLTPEMAKAAGDLAGEVYTSGFGESLEESNQAIRFITQNMGGLGDVTKDEMKDMTKGVLTLADAFGEDLNSVTATAGTLIKTGLAKDGKEALDILTRGLQSPANKAGDLLDTFTEYSTQFRQLGLTGPQALGLLNQGLAAGARDADTVADALKEFTILSQEAIDPASRAALAFQTLGLNASDMASSIAAGGEPAAAALQLTMDKLTPYIGTAQGAELATALFGTKAEDLQLALGAMDLSTATTQVGSVTGAMDTATTATDTNKAKVEEWKRTMEESVTTWIAETGAPALQGWSTDWENMTGTVGRFHDGLNGVGDGLRVLKDDIIDPIVGSLQGLYNVFEELSNSEFFKLVSSVGGGLTGLLGIGPDTLMAAGGGLAGLIGAFDTGGVVPGPKGKPRVILAHSGETILPTHKMSLSSAMASTIYEGDPEWDPWTMGNLLGPGGRTQEQFLADEKAGMEFAALGWPEEDVRAIADLIAGRGGTTTSSGGTVNNFYGPVMGEQDFIQKIRSGNYQAARTGRAFS